MRIQLYCGKLMTAISILAIAMTTGCEDPDQAKHNFGANDEDYIIAMGDSITARGYPSILARLTGKSVNNSGVDGAFTEDGAGRMGDTLSYNPGYVLLLFGANDIIVGISRAETIYHLRAMIKAAKANQTVPILGTLLPMTGEHAPYNASVVQLNAMIKDLGSDEGARVADIYYAFEGNSSYMDEDGLHPSDAGNAAIAKAFQKRLN